jgi:hypothetical protein
VTYLNNIVEQDHRAVKRLARPMLGVQIVPISSRDAHGHRIDAHDPEGPVADERANASGAGVLFASGIKQSQPFNQSRLLEKFATKPSRFASKACEMCRRKISPRISAGDDALAFGGNTDHHRVQP